MAVLGFVRRHPFNGPDLVSRVGRTAFSTLRVRPNRYLGHEIEIDPKDLSHAIIAEEFLIDELYQLDRLTFEPAVVLDCGAHIGLFTVLAAARYPLARVLAFEPAPRNIFFLRKQVAKFGDRVQVVEVAVSNYEGMTKFSDDAGFGGRLIQAAEPGAEFFDVKVVDLRSFIPREPSVRLLLKLDVEGEEEAILPGLVGILPRCCAVFFELHDGTDSWLRASKLFKEHRFQAHLYRRRDPFIDGFAIRTS